MLNARSIVNKVSEFEYLLLSYSLHVVIITETWLNNTIEDSCIVPVGYKIFRWDRDCRGGGVALVIKSSIVATKINCTFSEMVWCKVNYANTVYVIGAVYRPPCTPPEFLENLNMFLCSNVNENTRLIIADDFNLPHINWEKLHAGPVETANANLLLEIMLSHNLSQIVNDYTRVTLTSQSLLDLIFISSKVYDYEMTVENGISDHRLISMNVMCCPSVRTRPYVPVHVKDYCHADDTSILDYLELSLDDFQNASEMASIENLWSRFKEIIQHCIDNLTPTRTKKNKQKDDATRG